MSAWSRVPLGDVLRRSESTETVRAETSYKEITVKLWGRGVVQRGVVLGAEIAGARRFVAKEGQLIVSRIDARNGALGIVPSTLDGALVSNDFPLFDVATDKLDANFIGWLVKTNDFVELCKRASEGTTNRVRLQEDMFLALQIPLPPLAKQRRIVDRIERCALNIKTAIHLRDESTALTRAFRVNSLRLAMLNADAENMALEDVCESIIDNLHSNPRYSDIGVPCVRSPDVGWGTLHLDRALRTDEEEYRRRTVRGEPQTDDIVLVREVAALENVRLYHSEITSV